jgi:flagellar biosynthesis protein FlhA
MLLSAATAAMAVNAKSPSDSSDSSGEIGSLELADPNALPEPAPGSTEEVKALLGVDLLELEVGYELVPMVDVSSGGDLIDRIRALRRQFALDMGFIVPAIHIRDNVRLEPNQYRLLLKGVEITSGNVRPHHFLAMDPGGIEADIPGIETKEPAFGLDALWIAEADKERAQFSGYTVVDPPTVITTHLTEVVKANAHEILGRQEVQVLVDNLANDCPKLVEEVVPSVVSIGQIQQVLAGLLREGVSIRDLRSVLETLADWAPSTTSTERLIEHVRRALARAITANHVSEEGLLTLVSMSPTTERALGDALQMTEQGTYLALEPSTAQRFITKLKVAAERFAQAGATPILLAPAAMRSAMYAFTERFIPGFVILSHQEISPTTKVQSLGVVSIEE